MNILMLGWELPPKNSGGLGVACYHLCQELATQGVAIDFVIPYTLPLEHQPQFMRIFGATESPEPPVAAYHGWASVSKRAQNSYISTVTALVAANSYDAIHAHDWLTLQAGMHAKQLTGVPLIAHVHSTEYDRAGQASGNPLVHEIEQTGLLMADRIIAVSNATKRQLIDRYGLPANAIDVVYGGASIHQLASVAPSSMYAYLHKMHAHGYKVVVSLGRLTIQKGLSFLLQAARQALQVEQKLLFVIAGDGEQRDELINLSAELGISQNVLFTGFLRGQAWREAFAVGDMFVMSSVSEPYGLVALEAAGSGTAVLLTKQSGVSEVLRHTLQFDFWDTTRLADCIVAVARHESLQKALANNALRQVQTLSWGDAARSLMAIYARAGAAL